MRGLFLLTMKPVTYAANVAEDDLGNAGVDNGHVAALRAKAAEEGRDVVIVSAQVWTLSEGAAQLLTAAGGGRGGEGGLARRWCREARSRRYLHASVVERAPL